MLLYNRNKVITLLFSVQTQEKMMVNYFEATSSFSHLRNNRDKLKKHSARNVYPHSKVLEDTTYPKFV